MDLLHTEPFELIGEWWRADGTDLAAHLAKEVEPDQTQEPRVHGIDEGFAALQSDGDRLLGTDEEHAARGPLSFDPDEGLYLRLWGVSDAVFEAEPEQFAIHGYDIRGRPCSLLECFAVNTTQHLMAGFSERRILCHALVHGVHVDDLASFQFAKADIRIPGLRDFLTVGWGLAENESRTVSLEDGRVEFIPTRRVSHPDSHTEVEVGGAVARFELRGERNYLDWQERFVNPLMRLIILATGEPTRVESFAAILDVEQPGEPTPVPVPKSVHVDVVRQPKELLREPNFRRDRLLLSLGALGDEFDGVVARWWQVHDQLGGAPDFLFGVFTTKLPVEVQLMMVASVAEAYHRIRFPDDVAVERTRHEELRRQMVEVLREPNDRDHYFRRLSFDYELSQAERLIKVLRRAGEIVPALQAKPGRLATAVSATRNYIAHLPVDRPDEVLETGGDMYNATQLLLMAIQCNLLLDLEVPAARAKQLVSKRFSGYPYFRQLVKRACAWPRSA